MTEPTPDQYAEWSSLLEQIFRQRAEAVGER